jgi:hypothetical protein
MKPGVDPGATTLISNGNGGLNLLTGRNFKLPIINAQRGVEWEVRGKWQNWRRETWPTDFL